MSSINSTKWIICLNHLATIDSKHQVSCKLSSAAVLQNIINSRIKCPSNSSYAKVTACIDDLQNGIERLLQQTVLLFWGVRELMDSINKNEYSHVLCFLSFSYRSVSVQ